MKKINMGCGSRNFGKDWIHIDGGDHVHLDYHNITKLEFNDESIDLIYASHIIEYFDLFEIGNTLGEWHRVLKKNGILRVAVPDFEMMSRLYMEGQHSLERFLGPLYGRMKMGHETIYHRTTYDFNLLQKTLHNSGFKNVQRYDWRMIEHHMFDDHSQAYLPHMNKDSGTLISLNVECTRG
jgi:predicted SAM-dependent methyltransferase